MIPIGIGMNPLLKGLLNHSLYVSQFLSVVSVHGNQDACRNGFGAYTQEYSGVDLLHG